MYLEAEEAKRGKEKTLLLTTNIVEAAYRFTVLRERRKKKGTCLDVSTEKGGWGEGDNNSVAKDRVIACVSDPAIL